MIAEPSSRFLKRADDDLEYCDWWYCNESAFIVKWVIVGLIFAIFILWFVGGHFHAKSRMKKGLPPLAYHRFLVSRRERSRFWPQQPTQNNFSYYNHEAGRYNAPVVGHAYQMQPWVPPPPAYHEQGYAPPYPGAPSGSKVNPDQSFQPPPGPPPATVAGASSSSSAIPEGATTVREIDTANATTESDRLYSPASPSGLNRATNTGTAENIK